MIVPNRSFLAFQRPADKSAYGWRNDVPYLLARDTEYSWLTTATTIGDVRYFCKDEMDSGFKKSLIKPLSRLYRLNNTGTGSSVTRVKFNNNIEFAGSFVNGYYSSNRYWNTVSLRLEMFDPNANITPDEYIQQYCIYYNILEYDVQFDSSENANIAYEIITQGLDYLNISKNWDNLSYNENIISSIEVDLLNNTKISIKFSLNRNDLYAIIGPNFSGGGGFNTGYLLELNLELWQ